MILLVAIKFELMIYDIFFIVCTFQLFNNQLDIVKKSTLLWKSTSLIFDNIKIPLTHIF